MRKIVEKIESTTKVIYSIIILLKRIINIQKKDRLIEAIIDKDGKEVKINDEQGSRIRVLESKKKSIIIYLGTIKNVCIIK